MVTATQNSEHVVRRAIAAWESAVESGVKLQEESTKCLREAICNSQQLADWYQKAQTATAATIAKVQGNVDEGVRVINQQAESGVRLVQKALDAPRNGTAEDAPARMAEWWNLAMDSVCANSQALLQAHSRVLSSSFELLQKLNDDACNAMSDWAQHAAEHVEKMATVATTNVKNMAKQTSGD